MKPLSRRQQAGNILEFYPSMSPFHGVNLNQVAGVCNVIPLIATSKQTADKQTAEDTSDRVAKTKQQIFAAFQQTPHKKGSTHFDDASRTMC